MEILLGNNFESNFSFLFLFIGKLVIIFSRIYFFRYLLIVVYGFIKDYVSNSI